MDDPASVEVDRDHLTELRVRHIGKRLAGVHRGVARLAEAMQHGPHRESGCVDDRDDAGRDVGDDDLPERGALNAPRPRRGANALHDSPGGDVERSDVRLEIGRDERHDPAAGRRGKGAGRIRRDQESSARS